MISIILLIGFLLLVFLMAISPFLVQNFYEEYIHKTNRGGDDNDNI